jgi:hypothetical protein
LWQPRSKNIFLWNLTTNEIVVHCTPYSHFHKCQLWCNKSSIAILMVGIQYIQALLQFWKKRCIWCISGGPLISVDLWTTFDDGSILRLTVNYFGSSELLNMPFNKGILSRLLRILLVLEIITESKVAIIFSTRSEI